MAVLSNTNQNKTVFSEYELTKGFIGSHILEYNVEQDRMEIAPPSLETIRSAIETLGRSEECLPGFGRHDIYIDDVLQKFSEFHSTWATALAMFEQKMHKSCFSPIESLYNAVLGMRWNEEPTIFWLDNDGGMRSLSNINAFLDNMKELSYKDTSNLAERILVHMETKS